MTNSVANEPDSIEVGAPALVAGEAPQQRDFSSRAIAFAAHYAVVIVLVLLLIVATFTNDGFWQIDNLRNILTQNAAIALVSIGMTYVIIAGVFDLSVGALFAAGAVAYAGFAGSMPLPLAAVLTLLVGVGAGIVNGVIVTKLRVNSFIGTIGTAAIFSGIVYIASDSSPIPVDDPSFAELGLGRVGGVPWPLIVAVLVFAVAAFVLSKTVFGRYIYVTGGNPEAARLAGVPVVLVQIAAFVIVGALSVLAGMITASQLSVGQPSLGANVALDAFAIVVIGGTSVYGGEGALWRTAAGVMVLAVLTNIFNAMAWDTTRQSVAKGLVLVGAVALDALRRSRR
jgi:ribose/xylose/arabinose/galactoside ABC-type transport system permease subunit